MNPIPVLRPLIFFFFLSIAGWSQTIAEKKLSFQREENGLNPETFRQLQQINVHIETKRAEIRHLYEEAWKIYQKQGESTEYEPFLTHIKELKSEIAHIQQVWKQDCVSLLTQEEYALWHQPDTTIQQIVLDYGAGDYIYFIPPDIGGVRLSLNSNLPIPREAWGECLELILSEYGIGIRELNPYLRELYVVRQDPRGLKGIVSEIEELSYFSPQARVCFVLTPYDTDPRGDLFFLQKFSHPDLTTVDIIRGKIFITSTVETLQELLKLYSFVKKSGGKQEFQLVTLTKVPAREMEGILNTVFHSYSQSGLIPEGGALLQVLCLQHREQALFLCGTRDEVKKALALIQEVESQIEDPQAKTVFWYTAKHSDPEELAKVLAQVYDLLKNTGQSGSTSMHPSTEPKKPTPSEAASLIVPATLIAPSHEKKRNHKTADGHNNFIVDPKTGAIIMVVEQEALATIKELLKKLDVPKKMVQIEVLLFEKKFSNQNRFGLNLLRIGSEATHKAVQAFEWAAGASSRGISEFLFSHKKGSGIPAYDLAYQFLIGQEDVQINASPSITTLNQTPAKIAIVEEISIDGGADEKKNTLFNRAQYGITIEVTPTINLDDTDQESGFITLETNITFDTTKNNSDYRPDVTRRHIKNHVRIADGETVIIGGLRRKNSQDAKDSIPFLGEIPGLGKLFSSSEYSDNSTEMFVFITPKIIADPVQDAEKMRREELKRRPGDIPEFLQALTQAMDRQRKKLFQGSLSILFGPHADRALNRKQVVEYDGK